MCMLHWGFSLSLDLYIIPGDGVFRAPDQLALALGAHSLLAFLLPEYFPVAAVKISLLKPLCSSHTLEINLSCRQESIFFSSQTGLESHMIQAPLSSPSSFHLPLMQPALRSASKSGFLP
ncbi:hypothetical protein JOB18_023330 [Solea senegalensis]|uniref:Uncharacterized protein n=1 Tax=Solea senegalensis TaxID=28829 RepID=A0AAV6RD26_SOLSE|nr:hypothetical protein JOB18_023330 [Solea senegalensis]